jgi:protease I
MKALLVIGPDFRDEEYQIPKEVLEDAGVDVVTAAPSDDECTGAGGKVVAPDKMLSEVNARDYEAIVVVGGPGARENLWDNQDLLDLLASAAKAKKVVAGICISAAVLANAGVLEGKDATVFETPESLDALEEGGANYVNEPLVVDGKVITANGPKAAQDFAEAILEAMGA